MRHREPPSRAIQQIVFRDVCTHQGPRGTGGELAVREEGSPSGYETMAFAKKMYGGRRFY